MSQETVQLNTILDFGKHAGQEVEDILEDDPQYLVWLYQLDNKEFDPDLIRKMESKKLI